jgi:cyclomaltodextrinase / maltogenic alpha-amylase / neopullulanase
MMDFSIPSWVHKSVFYQIFPERFCNGDPANDPAGALPWGSQPGLDTFMGGDLAGIIEQLPYLADLGVNALYFTPIFMARTNHKYDASDYMKIDPAFGNKDTLKRLVDEAHKRDIRIVMDAVFNHCGDGFWAFQDLINRGNKSKYGSWFTYQELPVVNQPTNYQTCGGTYYLPKLNTQNREVREYLLGVTEYWLKETGMDGWRLDVPWKVPLDFWKEFRDVVKKANPDAYIVAEAWRDPGPWVNQGTADAIMNYPLREYIFDYCFYDRMDAEDFEYFVQRVLSIYGSSMHYQLNLLGSHDTARVLTNCNDDIQRLSLAMIAAFTLPGTPMIYYGDEIGMLGGNDPDCRRCMNWNQETWNHDIRQLYQTLIRLRKTHTALQTGGLQSLFIFNGVYVYQRKKAPDEVIVVLNPREARQMVEFQVPDTEAKAFKELFTGTIYPCENNKITLNKLSEKSALILIPVS